MAIDSSLWLLFYVCVTQMKTYFYVELQRIADIVRLPLLQLQSPRNPFHKHLTSTCRNPSSIEKFRVPLLAQHNLWIMLFCSTWTQLFLATHKSCCIKYSINSRSVEIPVGRRPSAATRRKRPKHFQQNDMILIATSKETTRSKKKNLKKLNRHRWKSIRSALLYYSVNNSVVGNWIFVNAMTTF